MQRIYYKDLQIGNQTFTLKDEEIFHQLVRVLRSKVNDEIAFFDGVVNLDFVYSIKKIAKREIVFDFVESYEINNEIDFNLNLYQALPNKLEKLEYILQKGTEVGYSKFFIYKSERSQDLFLSANKIDRLKKIIVEAIEQSGRQKVPELIILDKLKFGDLEDNENIFFHTLAKDDDTFLKNLKINYDKDINLFIGPEGGFSEKEVEIFLKNKFKKVFLGNRILRTETCPVATGFYIIQNK